MRARKKDERTRIGLALAVVATACLVASFATPWWQFEESTGRQAAPDGPHGPEGFQENRRVDFYATHPDGAPTDGEVAAQTATILQVGLFVAAAALIVYALGQLPGISRMITRPICIVAAGTALAGIIVALYAGWNGFPASMAAAGIEGPFTSKLLEDGYVRGNLFIGWVAAVFAGLFSVAALTAAYGAGNADPSVIEEYAI